MAKSKPALDTGALGDTSGENHHPVDVIHNERAGVAKSRIGKSNITGYFDPEFKTKFKRLALDKGKSAQALLEEAIIDLFKKHRVGE